jgi:hypothetical protein
MGQSQDVVTWFTPSPTTHRDDHAISAIFDHNAVDFVGVNRRRSYICVVDGSACPTVRWTSSDFASFSKVVVMNVARMEWAE